jgi:MFS family permease
LFLQERSFNKGEITLVLASLSAGGLVAPLVAGYLSDAIGRRNTLVVSLTSSALSLIVLYFCQNLMWLVVCSTIHGFALFRLALNLGFAAGPTVAGLLFVKAPFLIFIGDAATTLVFALLAVVWLPHGLRTIKGKVSSVRVILRSWNEAFLDMLKHRPILQYLLTIFLVATCFQQVFNVLSIASTDNGLTPSQYGLVMAFNGLLIVVIELPLCQWMQRLDYKRVITLGYVCIAIGTGSFCFAKTMSGYLIAIGLFTLGEIISFPIGMAYMSRLTPVAYRGRYFGFKGMMWGLAGIFSSVGIWFHGRIGDSWWLWAGSIALLGSALMIPKLRDRR